MKFIKVNTYEELSRKTANLISAQVLSKPDCVLGLATGSSPVGAYKVLIERCAKGDQSSFPAVVFLFGFLGHGDGSFSHDFINRHLIIGVKICVNWWKCVNSNEINAV